MVGRQSPSVAQAGIAAVGRVFDAVLVVARRGLLSFEAVSLLAVVRSNVLPARGHPRETGIVGVVDQRRRVERVGVDTHPDKISANGGKYVFDVDGEFSDTQQVVCEYSGDGKPGSRRMFIYKQRLWTTNYPYNCDSGAELYGTKGQMFLSRRGKVQVTGERNAPITVELTAGAQNDLLHVKNLCDAIRDGAKLNAEALTGHLSTSLCDLGNIATRLGRSLKFDPTTEHVVGDAEADALVRRKYREHWGTPKGV